MKKITLFGILAVLIVGTVFSASMVNAYRGDYSKEGPNFSDERHEAMDLAFETGNYDSWYALMTEDGKNPRVVDVVTADNFDMFVQAHDAGKSGDFETANELREELGLNDGHGPKDGTGFRADNGQGKRMGSGQGEGFGPESDHVRGEGRGLNAGLNTDCVLN